jgi:hypothetical protein
LKDCSGVQLERFEQDAHATKQPSNQATKQPARQQDLRLASANNTGGFNRGITHFAHVLEPM